MVHHFLNELRGDHELTMEQLLFLDSLINLPFLVREPKMGSHHHYEE